MQELSEQHFWECFINNTTTFGGVNLAYNQLILDLKQNNIDFYENEPMSDHTSFKIGGNADIFITPKSEEDCSMAVLSCKKNNVEYIVIGNGSNLLVSDNGFRGAVICISSAMSNIWLIDDNTIFCEAGASLACVCNFALKNSLTGLEFAYGIPGNIGGAISMNAGAYGGEIKDVLVECSYIDDCGNIKKILGKELDFSYRHSFFTNKNYCIVSVVIKLNSGNTDEIRAQMTEILKKRKEKQPLEYPSAGSTFKRPEGSYASLLIDECGLKGCRIGDAQVSEKHAGFIVNIGKATCDDVLSLIEYVKQDVQAKTGYILEPEVKII